MSNRMMGILFPVNDDETDPFEEPKLTAADLEKLQHTYTRDQIRAAFWKTFHKEGELFFDYLSTDEVNEASTQAYWIEFLENLGTPRP